MWKKTANPLGVLPIGNDNLSFNCEIFYGYGPSAFQFYPMLILITQIMNWEIFWNFFTCHGIVLVFFSPDFGQHPPGLRIVLRSDDWWDSETIWMPEMKLGSTPFMVNSNNAVSWRNIHFYLSSNPNTTSCPSFSLLQVCRMPD